MAYKFIKLAGCEKKTVLTDQIASSNSNALFSVLKNQHVFYILGIIVKKSECNVYSLSKYCWHSDMQKTRTMSIPIKKNGCSRRGINSLVKM